MLAKTATDGANPRTSRAEARSNLRAVTSASLSATDEQALAAARGGDESAFGRIVDAHRNELQAHCYRMLGSAHDAEDALQEALLRAWRAIGRFEGRSSVRSWLYKIATNTCLDAIARRPKRVLPIDYGPAQDPHEGSKGTVQMGDRVIDAPAEPIIESVWVEPYPDERLGVEDGLAGPEASYEQRESVELAFIAALQHLPPNQRAVLILREVLGFSAQEVSESLETSTASINSALQRARKTVEEKLPDRSQQETLRSLGDDGIREIVERYTDAMQRGDVDAVVAMLTEEATWSMPPMPSWFRGREGVAGFLRQWPLSGDIRWKHVPTRTNGQLAIGCYTWDDEAASYLPFCIDVLTLDGSKIEAVTAFLDPSLFPRFGLPAELAG
jgi:RNA polymerase sigma-70 factor (ECF subfamily)